MLYWPMAIVKYVDMRTVKTQFTYSGCTTIEEAKEIIEKWKSDENIIVYFAYITDDNGTMLHFENCVDALGNVDYYYKKFHKSERENPNSSRC